MALLQWLSIATNAIFGSIKVSFFLLPNAFVYVFIYSFVYLLICLFIYSIWVFFLDHSRITGLQGVVLVPCLRMEVHPYSHFRWCGYF